LQNAIEHTTQFAGSRKSAAKVQIRENILKVSAASPEYGEAKECIEVDSATSLCRCLQRILSL
jgi:DNA polymerase III sliding clamp (beta) subunit (PCNA family)